MASAVLDFTGVTNAGLGLGVRGVDAAGGSEDDFCAATLSGAVERAEDCAGGRVSAGPDMGSAGVVLTIGGGAAAVVGAVMAGGVTKEVAGAGDSSPEVNAPPELRITTSGATELVWVVCVGDCVVVVVPAGGVVNFVFVFAVVPDTVDDGGVDTDSVSVVVLVVLVVFGESGEFVASVVLSSEVLASESGVAHATPGVVATAIPTPSATANAPTRPMYFA